MNHLNTQNLSPLALGKLNKALDRQYRFDDGSIMTMRKYIETNPITETCKSNGMMDYNRRHFNSLGSHKAQADYMARLEAKTYYFINGIQVPKIIFDAISET